MNLDLSRRTSRLRACRLSDGSASSAGWSRVTLLRMPLTARMSILDSSSRWEAWVSARQFAMQCPV